MNYELGIKGNTDKESWSEERANNSLFLIRDSRARGYTMIELLVTIGIIGLISSIVLANYPKFSEQLSVSQTAHAIALAFREAKTYALAVRQHAGSYQVGYGVHFDKATPQTFILYATPLNSNNTCNPVNNNCVRGSMATYDVDTLTMKSGIQLISICDVTTGTTCYEKLDVAYVRPDPIVYIIGTDAGGAFSQRLTNIRIKIRAPGGQEKSIDVWETGQVSVQ